MEVVITVALGIVQGRSTNVSRGGVSVIVPESIMPGADVFVRFPTIDRSAFAHVQRCVARGNEYEVALAFRDGLSLDDRTMADFKYDRASGDSSWNDPFA